MLLLNPPPPFTPSTFLMELGQAGAGLGRYQYLSKQRASVSGIAALAGLGALSGEGRRSDNRLYYSINKETSQFAVSAPYLQTHHGSLHLPFHLM